MSSCASCEGRGGEVGSGTDRSSPATGSTGACRSCPASSPDHLRMSVSRYKLSVRTETTRRTTSAASLAARSMASLASLAASFSAFSLAFSSSLMRFLCSDLDSGSPFALTIATNDRCQETEPNSLLRPPPDHSDSLEVNGLVRSVKGRRRSRSLRGLDRVSGRRRRRARGRARAVLVVVWDDFVQDFLDASHSRRGR